MSTYMCGIDEAGRGPVIGPMVMCLVAVEEAMEFEFKTLGVTDSKLLSPIRRKELAEVIKREGLVEYEVVSPEVIDEAVNHHTRNLNILEAEVSGRLINAMVKRVGKEKIKRVILDCPTNNPESYLKEMGNYVDEDLELLAEHKADVKYPVASAASIIAKVVRDEEIEKLKKVAGKDFGSGYPSDPLTIEFVKNHYHEFNFFRKSWETYKRQVVAGQQQSLDDFGARQGTDQAHKNADVERLRKNMMMLLEKGFVEVPVKGNAEVLRIKGEGATITLYNNGKLLTQGREKESWETFVRGRVKR